MSQTREKLPEWIYRGIIAGLLALTFWFAARLVEGQDKLAENMRLLTEEVYDLKTRVTVLEAFDGR